MAGAGFRAEEVEHKTHVLYCPGCKLTYKLLHKADSGTDCAVCREHGGAEKPRKNQVPPRSYTASPFSRDVSRAIPLSRELAEEAGRVYPPPPCSGSTCPREVIVPPICPPMAPCDRGGAAKVCPSVKPKRFHDQGGGIGAIPVLHELTQQNPDHLEGPVFLADRIMFSKQDFEDVCEPIEVACETTSIHWPLNYTEGSQTEAIEVYPLPGCIEPIGCVTEMLEPSKACFDPSLNSVPVGHILTMEECVSPTCDLIEVARECTSVHRPPWTDSIAQTDPVRTIPYPIATECQEVITGIDRESVDATHDRVTVHSERVCYESDPACERLLTRTGEVILRPPQEVARVPLPDRIIIEDHEPSDESQQVQQEVTQSLQSRSAGFKNLSGEWNASRSESAKGSAKPGRSKSASKTSSSASIRGWKGGK